MRLTHSSSADLDPSYSPDGQTADPDIPILKDGGPYGFKPFLGCAHEDVQSFSVISFDLDRELHLW
jgi:hypothetical protein